MTSIALHTQELTIGYREKSRCKEVHSRLNVALRAGRVTALLGANGIGKSTLLRTLAGFQPALAGTVYWQGKRESLYAPRERSQTVGVVLTERSTAGGLRVAELVALGRHPHTNFLGRMTRYDRERVDEAMALVGISEMAKRFVAELSDGERQKVMIAKVLAQECPIILLDEPTAFLDVSSRIELMILLRQLAATQQKAILYSTHDIDLALTLSDQLWLLQTGEQPSFTAGTPETLALNGSIAQCFERKEVVFDKCSGRLTHHTSQGQRVYLQIDDPKIAFWTANALRRYAFIPCTDIPSASPIITYTDNQLCWNNGKTQQAFPSIDALIAAIAQQL